MNDITILIIALIFYILGLVLAFTTKIKYIHLANGLLWFIPIFMVPNPFIIIFSIIMIFISVMLTFFDENENEF